MFTFNEFKHLILEKADADWDINLALPPPTSPNYAALKTLFANKTIWAYSKKARSLEIVFHNSNVPDLIQGSWSVDRGNHKYMVYLSADGTKVKLRQTGKAGADSTRGIASYQESGVCLWMDALLNGVDDIQDYTPSDFYQSQDDAAFVEAWLAANPPWNHDCKITAEDIIKELGKLNLLKNYQVHKGTEIYKKIRKIGGELSGVHPDKWNPADIMLIKRDLKAYNKAIKSTNIVQYNTYFADLYGDLIGISLKGSTAIQGCISSNLIPGAEHAISQAKPKSLRFRGNQLTDDEKQIFLDAFTRLKKKASALKRIYIPDTGEAISSSIMNISSVKPAFSGMPYMVSLLSGFDSVEEMEDYMFNSYMFARSSISDISSVHWKAMAGKGMHEIRPGLDWRKFKLDQVIVPVNGQTTITIKCTYDGKPVILSWRAKGFMATPTVEIASASTRKRAIKLIKLTSAKL